MIGKEWSTSGIIPNRAPWSYQEQTPLSGLASLEPESLPVRRKCEDLLRWVQESLPDGGELLDIGAGPAHLQYWAERLNSPIQVISYDISTEHLKTAAKRVGDKGKLVSGDMSDLPFSDASFEGVLSSDILEHVYPEDAVQVVEEGSRVLKPGGWIFINIPNRESWSEASWRNPEHVWLPSKKEMVDLLGRNGFNNEKLEATTRGFPGSNLFHHLAGRDLYIPFWGRSIFVKAQKIH